MASGYGDRGSEGPVQAHERPLAQFEAARTDPDRVVLEGFHALKHALRFGADVEFAVTPDPAAFEELAAEVAPDVPGRLATPPLAVAAKVWAQLCPGGLPSPALAIARRPHTEPEDIVATGTGPVVLLEDPTHLGNLGAAVRVAAAAGAAGVITTGRADPWHPAAVRAAAGLHFAVPVARASRPPLGARTIVAIHPDGEPLRADGLPPRPILAFGTERRGLSEDLLAAADRRVRIPMREGVSSLNLATAVAVVLYSQVLGAGSRGLR